MSINKEKKRRYQRDKRDRIFEKMLMNQKMKKKKQVDMMTNTIISISEKT
jgi:hypothetical protein